MASFDTISSPRMELILIHSNGGPSAYDTRWFYYDKNGVLSLVNSTMSGAGGSNPYTYTLSDGSTLQIYNYFSSGYWGCKFTSSKDRDIKINLNFDGTGPTTYHLTANTESEEILIPQLTEFTGYNNNPRYNGGPGLIIEV